MKSNKYIIITIFIITIFYNSCSSDTFVPDFNLKFCGDCANTGNWTVNSLGLNPCFSTNTECLNWAKTHGYPDTECVLCN